MAFPSFARTHALARVRPYSGVLPWRSIMVPVLNGR